MADARLTDRVKRIGSVAGHLAKNVAAPVLIPVKPNRVLGVDGDPVAAGAALDDLAPALAGVRQLIDGSTVLELGPGKTAELSGALLLAGARAAVGFDTRVSLKPGADANAALAALGEHLGTGRSGSRFLEAVGLAAEDLPDRVRRVTASDSWPLPVKAFDGARLPLAGASVDLAFSKSVFEHVPVSAVEPLLTELHRVVRPDGAAVHAIDLRDHFHLDTDERVIGDWLEALTYPPRLFHAMFGNRSNYINRLRADAWRVAFARTGWRVEVWEERRWPLPDGFDRDRLRPAWRDAPSDVLEVGFIWVALRPTEPEAS